MKIIEPKNKPRVLILDIETAPIMGYIWTLWNNNLGLSQINKDWHLLSWSAKWLDQKGVMYMDQRNEKNMEDDRKLLKVMWKLLDKCDVVITQNGKKFDIKKLNARFILNGFKPPSSFKHIDVYEIAKKKFALTSNKLEYMTDKLCKKNKKLKHKNYPGFELWKACLAGDTKAWNEMKRYNKNDVTSLEELYKVVIPWDNRVNFNLYHDNIESVCKCGSKRLHKRGYAYTAVSKFQRFRCKDCGAEVRGRKNLFSAEKSKALKVRIKE